MAGQPLSSAELLRKRLSLVAAISALNAEAVKCIQAIGAAEMDVLHIELEWARAGRSSQLVRDLHEAEMSADANRAARSECEERIAAAEREVEEIDRQLAADGH